MFNLYNNKFYYNNLAFLVVVLVTTHITGVLKEHAHRTASTLTFPVKLA
jgi:hypothetical protein